jgi:hypothetical protein
MNSSLRTALLTSTLALMAGALHGKTASEKGPPQMLSIRLYDQAKVPAQVLHSAADEVSWLFRAARIRISWECPSSESPGDQGTDMTGAPFRQPDNRRYIVVRLMRGTPVTLFPRALGYALPFAQTGAHVLIFYDRVDALTRRVDAAMYIILGHAMAHEIAHVLLGSTEHSTGGLMESCWTPADWRLASQGLLTFRREEIERLGARVRRFQFAGPIRDRELALTSSQPSQSRGISASVFQKQ